MIRRHRNAQITLLVLSLENTNNVTTPYVQSRNRKKYYHMLSKEKKRNRDRRIPRMSLQDPYDSSWRKLYNSKNNQAMITLTGLDIETFEWLKGLLSPMFNAYSPYKFENGKYEQMIKNKGRKRMIDVGDCLALNLAWSRFSGTTAALQMIFGMTGSSVSAYLMFGRRIIIDRLQHNEDANIKIPTNAKIKEYQEAVSIRHPKLPNVWCTMDGLKLTLNQSTNAVVQNYFYNGWTHDHYVTGVFVFCPDGKIPIATFNVPGSIHDSVIAEWGKYMTN